MAERAASNGGLSSAVTNSSPISAGTGRCSMAMVAMMSSRAMSQMTMTRRYEWRSAIAESTAPKPSQGR